MNQISFFLEKFKNIELQGVLVREALILAVKEECGILLPESAVSLKNGTLIVRAHPAAKSELFMKKERILARVERILGKKIHNLR